MFILFENKYAILALSIIMLLSCQYKKEEVIVEHKDIEKIKAVMDAHVDSLMEIDGVVGVAIGALENGSYCIKVMVKSDDPKLRKKIPDQLENYPVVIEVTGVIRALSTER